MANFAVIDTETNWGDQVMSIGIVLASDANFEMEDGKYYIFPQECQIGGMYENTLLLPTPVAPVFCSRAEAMEDLKRWLNQHEVHSLFAYNASFDCNHLPELRCFRWHDIMRLAAYRQHNSKIPSHIECCSTGRMKRGFGVEAMLRLLSGNHDYQESHNAYFDALDELTIMQLLPHPLPDYPPLLSSASHW